MANRPAPEIDFQASSFISLNELERLCQDNPIDYLVQGLIPAGDVHVAVGDSGLGKTPWAYQLGLCVAAGIPFLGYPTRQGKVLYIDLENGPQAVRNVAASLHGFLGIGSFPEDFWVSREDVAVPDLSIVVPECRPSLVIVDTLRAFRPSAETQNEEAGKLLNQLRATARPEHCAILLLHHLRKPGELGPQALEDRPVLEWLLAASGARAIINQTSVRIGLDVQRGFSTREAALVMKCFIKRKGTRDCNEAKAWGGYGLPNS